MSVSAIGSISGTSNVTAATTDLQRAQQKLAADLAAKAAAARDVEADRDAKTAAAQDVAADRNAVARAKQASEAATAAQEAQRTMQQQMLPAAQTLQQQSKPITASNSALGGSFDVRV